MALHFTETHKFLHFNFIVTFFNMKTTATLICLTLFVAMANGTVPKQKSNPVSSNFLGTLMFSISIVLLKIVQHFLL